MMTEDLPHVMFRDFYDPTFYTWPEEALPEGKRAFRLSIKNIPLYENISLWAVDDLLYGVVETKQGYRIATVREFKRALNALGLLIKNAAQQQSKQASAQQVASEILNEDGFVDTLHLGC